MMKANRDVFTFSTKLRYIFGSIQKLSDRVTIQPFIALPPQKGCYL